MAAPLLGFAGLVTGRSSALFILPLVVLVSVGPWVMQGLLNAGPSHRRAVAVAFVTSQTASATVGCLQYLGFSPFGIPTPFGRSQGLAGHPNVLAIMASVVILGLIQRRMTARSAPLTIYALLVNVVALIASGSISALAAAAVAIFAYVWASRRLTGASLVAAGAGLAAFVLAMSSSYVSRLLLTIEYRVGVVSGTESGGGAASLENRQRTYEWAWSHIQQSPLFGVGLDPAAGGTYDGVTVVHNFFLRAWYQGGITYALWFAVLIALLVGAIVGPALARQRPELAYPAAGVVLIFTFASTAAFLEQAQYWLPLIYYVAVAGVSTGSSASPADSTDAARDASIPEGRPLQ